MHVFWWQPSADLAKDVKSLKLKEFDDSLAGTLQNMYKFVLKIMTDFDDVEKLQNM
jgi:hypothetical protein